jgi:hypothetical protein
VNYRDIPKWVRNQRYKLAWCVIISTMAPSNLTNSIVVTIETLQAVDESIDKIIEWVKSQGLAKQYHDSIHGG